jgi:3-deoxy-D-manno-octulosonic-acid transferase
LGEKTTPVFVAGSTWNEDEEVLFEALPALLRDKKLKWIIAPHEPSPSHISALGRRLKEQNLDFQLWSKAETWEAPVLLVDQVGVLAELYLYGDIAFVGGSFKSKVHSVMEPLAAGCPTMVGPYHANNREALEFQKLSLAGRVIGTDTSANTDIDDLSMVSACENAGILQARLLSLLQRPDLAAVRDRIQREISSRTGASARLLAERGL